ncbi:MAG: sulfotransferase family protein [Solirubrobacteraceae bacterium]
MTASSEAAVDAQRSPLRAPDFFIVGHAKSGTTALYEMLRPHPQIYMSHVKEPWFFSTDMEPRFNPWRTGIAPQTLEQYLALFAGAQPGQRAGEASSSYLWSRTAARGIAEVQPNAKIIAILREPASFLRSLHLQLLQNHVEVKKELRKAIALEQARSEGRHIPRRSHRPQMLQYSDHVRYVEQLRRYHDLFPAEQVLVLIYDDFRRDNEAALRTVLRFLEVDDTWPVNVMDTNQSVLVRSQQLDDLVHAVSVGRGPVTVAAKAAIKALAPRDLRRNLLEFTRRRIVQGEPPAPDEQFMLELRRRFKGEVVALSEYLDRDLVALWGYDTVD